jgi:hypothetical protein
MIQVGGVFSKLCWLTCQRSILPGRFRYQIRYWRRRLPFVESSLSSRLMLSKTSALVLCVLSLRIPALDASHCHKSHCIQSGCSVVRPSRGISLWTPMMLEAFRKAETELPRSPYVSLQSCKATSDSASHPIHSPYPQW